MGDEAKAQQYWQDAEKKMKSSGSVFSSIFGSGSSKMEEASELYQKAGNLFKMAKNWTSAGKSYCNAAEIQMKLNSKHDSATMYIEAANAYRKIDANEAIQTLLRAADIYIDMGRLVMAAKQYQAIAELCESDIVDVKTSMEYYEKAADLYKTEENNAYANKCLLKVAQFAAQLEQYSKAIEIYEQIGTASIENALLKYGAKDHFFRAGICHLCVDVINCQQAITRYEGLLQQFKDSRESNLLKALIAALEEKNLEQYSQALKDYDNISRLDNWCTTLFLRIKKAHDDEPDLT